MSTYKSDLVSSLPERQSNDGAHLCIVLGMCGLGFALLVGSIAKDVQGLAAIIGVIGVVILVVGIGTKKPANQLATAQASWDNRWLCASCGYQWQA